MADARKTPETGSAVCGRGQSIGQPCQRDTAERLRDELIDYALETDAEDIDVQRVDQLLARLDELDPQPESALSGPLKAPGAADEADPAGPDFHSSKKVSTVRKLKNLLYVAAILVVVSISLAVTAIGDKQEAAGTWDNERFQLDGSGKSDYAVIRQHPLEEGETKTYASVQDMLDDFEIDGHVAPTWVPERLGEPTVQAEYSSHGLNFCIDYDTGEEFLSVYCSEIPPANNQSTEKDYQGANVERITNIQHYTIVDMGITKVVWENGELECHLTGNLSEEEMKEVLYSIYED